MKTFKVLISIMLVLSVVTGGCSFSDTDKTQDEQAIKEILNEDEYVEALADIVGNYADAYIQLNLIFNTDPERVDFETWQGWVSENLERWQKIEKDAEAIIKYLDSLEDADSGVSFIPSASAQSFMPDKIEFDPESVLPTEQDHSQFVLPVIDYEGDEVYTGAREVELIDPSANLYHQAIKTAEEAPQGEGIKAIMERFGYEDARTAASLLEDARDFDTRRWEETADARDFLSRGSSTIRNTAFTTVAVGGVIMTGGKILTTKSTAARVWGEINLLFGGADLVLQAGEKASTIVDNRTGETFFRGTRESLKPINAVLGFIGLGDGLTGGNLVTLYGYGESAVSYMDEVDKKETDIEEERQLFMTDFGGGHREVSLSYNGNFTSPYENSPEFLMANLEALFPKDAVVEIDDSYVNVSDINDIRQLLETPPIELAEPETVPVAPPEQEVEAGSFFGSYVFTDAATGIDTIGTLTFQMSGGEISGSSELSTEGAVTRMGVTTTVSGSGSGQITGSYDNAKNEIYIGGNYDLTSVSTTSGHSHTMSDSGTLVFEGTMSEFNVFSGNVTLQTGMGPTLTTTWRAERR